MSNTPHFDEHGRGPLTRLWHERLGYDPAKHGYGFASFASAMDRARTTGNEFPEQFRRMLTVLVGEVVVPLLEAERAAVRADVEAVVNALVDERLVPVREAYTALLRRVERLERAAPRPAMV